MALAVSPSCKNGEIEPLRLHPVSTETKIARNAGILWPRDVMLLRGDANEHRKCVAAGLTRRREKDFDRT